MRNTAYLSVRIYVLVNKLTHRLAELPVILEHCEQDANEYNEWSVTSV